MSLLLLSTASSTFADSATWKTSPATGDWNHAANWTPQTIPNGPSDTATFATSNTTSVSLLSGITEVNGIVFNPGASAFTITATPTYSALVISGAGIANNSGVGQNFVTTALYQGGDSQIIFTNSATAGSGTFFTNNGPPSGGGSGITEFFGTSTAGNGTFTNNGGSGHGVTEFFQSSTAGNGIFTNNGGAASGELGGATFFLESSTAGHGTFINNGGAVSGASGGEVVFETFGGPGIPTAGNAMLIANGGLDGGAGGLIDFRGHSSGSTARVELFGNGSLDISYHGRTLMTIGSIEGNGNVFLGARKLRVGSNNLSTTFSGMIQDGGVAGGAGGSLTKIGSGKLVLRHRNTYTGVTVIEHGKLIVNNKSGSGTGSGPVYVNHGTLGGKGIIAGDVTVGTGTGRGATLSPGYVHGAGSPGALTIQSPLTFNSDATYDVDVNSSIATADEVIANGVTINSGAQFSFADIGSGTLTPGTVFTVINNTAATPIAGTFSNLPDGSIFTSNGNTYQVSYEGGDGNDLTLTVVP
jgi:autotransporter-associated beta strand protein